MNLLLESEGKVSSKLWNLPEIRRKKYSYLPQGQDFIFKLYSELTWKKIESSIWKVLMLKWKSNFSSFSLPFTILMETSQQQHLSCFFILWALWLRFLTSTRSSDHAVIASYNSDLKYILTLSLHRWHIPNRKSMEAGGKVQVLKYINSIQSLGCLHMSWEQNSHA